MGVLQPANPGDELGISRIGDISDLMCLAAEGAQHVDDGLVAFGQHGAVAKAHHLTAATLILAAMPGR
jgi:hypothetical protein